MKRCSSATKSGTNTSPIERTAVEESCPKRKKKTQKSIDKVRESVFWDAWPFIHRLAYEKKIPWKWRFLGNIGSNECINKEKNTFNAKPSTYTEYIILRIAWSVTLISRSVCRWLLAFCEKNVPENLGPMKTWFPKMRHIFRTRTNPSARKERCSIDPQKLIYKVVMGLENANLYPWNLGLRLCTPIKHLNPSMSAMDPIKSHHFGTKN